jgi:hypothetical protein
MTCLKKRETNKMLTISASTLRRTEGDRVSLMKKRSKKIIQEHWTTNQQGAFMYAV